jgi:hypothetical protein
VTGYGIGLLAVIQIVLFSVAVGGASSWSDAGHATVGAHG